MTGFFCWIFLYIAVNAVIPFFALSAWVNVGFAVVYTVCLGIWLWREKSCRDWLVLKKRGWLAAWPLFVFAVANAVFLQGVSLSVAFFGVAVGAIAEELLFRGVLLSALSRKSAHIAVWGSAVLFGVYHLFSGDLFGAVCALCFGFALAVYAYRFRSLLPCIAAHLLTNLLGNSGVPAWLLVLSSIICVIYGCILYPRKKEN